MGELMDSSYACSYTVAGITIFTQNYTATLGSLVWEVGNEVNGSWPCNGGSTHHHSAGGGVGSAMQKVEAMYNTVTALGGAQP